MTIGPCLPGRPSPSSPGVDFQPVSEPPPPRRPLVERLGLALIAITLAVLFAGVAVAAWLSGEPFLAAMGAIGCVMTVWAGGLTLLRG